jgi:hypothetical protein
MPPQNKAQPQAEDAAGAPVHRDIVVNQGRHSGTVHGTSQPRSVTSPDGDQGARNLRRRVHPSLDPP